MRIGHIVLFFGFIWTGKGIDVLFAAFARLARRIAVLDARVGAAERAGMAPSS